MHICMVTPELFNAAGIGYYVYNLSKKLVEKGHNVTIMTRGSFQRTTDVTIDGIHIYHVTTPRIYPFHVWMHGLFLNQVFSPLQSQFDVVHLHSPVTPIVKTNLPVLTTIHSLYKTMTSSKLSYQPFESLTNFQSLAEMLQSTFLASLEEKNFKQSKKLSSVCQANIRYLNQYNLKPQNVTIVGNGVHEDIFKPKTNTAFKTQNIIFVGRILVEKGIMTFIQCAEHVLKTHPNVNFLIAGKGPLRDTMEKLVQTQGLQRNIVFLGMLPRKRLIELYQEAYIQIIPSLSEGLPNVLLEAMSSGVPVIATTVGGIPEVISSGENGFLVAPRSPLKMAKIVTKLLEDVELRNRLGRAARKTIETQYTWDKTADRILQCCFEIL